MHKRENERTTRLFGGGMERQGGRRSYLAASHGRLHGRASGEKDQSQQNSLYWRTGHDDDRVVVKPHAGQQIKHAAQMHVTGGQGNSG